MWKNYHNTFPIRYIQHGYFDDFVSNLVEKSKPKSILDVGGGIGTKVLKDIDIPVDILDPYVVKPEWMRNKITWNSMEKYDLVVARGCINYLSIEELEKLSTFSANLAANTFKNPPLETWTEREFENNSGESGIERFRLVNKEIEHQLVFNDRVINHSFFYRTKDEWEKYLGPISVIEYGKNSVILLKNCDKSN